MADILIFDWDGTLHNTAALYGSAFRRAYSWLVENKYAPKRFYTDEEMSKYLGFNALDMWNNFMPELPDEIKTFCSNMVGDGMVSEIEAGSAMMYDGAEKVLRELRKSGYTLVFLSNCKHRYMEAHRREFTLDRFFSGYYACEDYGFAPKPEIFEQIRKDFPGNYVVIGDRFSDIEVALVHGLKSIGCRYGFSEDPGELSGATLIADNVRDIPKLISEL